MLIRRMVDHQFRDDAKSTFMRLVHEMFEIAQGPIGTVDAAVVGNVIAVVALRRRGDLADDAGEVKEVSW
jgi:hypothetical protein